MDLPVIFEGIRGNVSQEEHITALVKMAEPVGHLKQPPTLLVVGATPLPHVHWWVIENMKWDNQNVTWVRKGASLVRLRQSVVISLLEYVDEEVIITQPTPAIAAGAGPVGTKIKTGSGLTAKQEAQKEYGDPGLYTKILEANPWLPIDQRLGIANGVTFVVPPANSK
jgi:hypothetical protein